MIERLKAMREPMGWALLVLIWLGWVVGFAQMGFMISAGGSFFSAFQDLGNSMMSLVLVGLLVLIVLSCVFVEPMTAGSPRLVRWSAWSLVVGTGLTLISTLAGLVAHSSLVSVFLEFVGASMDVMVKVVACVLMFLVDREVQRHLAQSGPIEQIPVLGELKIKEM